MDNNINNNQSHHIKFTTSDWGENEHEFLTEPITDYQDLGMDHHIQCRIIQYIKNNNIKGKDQKYIYYDNKMNVIMRNDHALEHGKFEIPE